MKKLVFVLIPLIAFSLTKQTLSIKASSISGKIFSINGSPLKGIKVELKNYNAKEVKNYFFQEGKARIDNVWTNPEGRYEFKSLLEGNYYLTIEFPKKLKKAYEYINKPTMPIKLISGQNIKDADFTLKQIRTIISGKIYKRDAVTAYTNVSLELSNNGKTYSTTTDEKGEYIFMVEPGNGKWKITIKDKNKIVPYPLNLDLTKVNTFKNVNIICAK